MWADWRRPPGRSLGGPARENKSPSRVTPKTPAFVVVEHADGFHEGFADGRPNEAKPALPQVPRQHRGVSEAPDIRVEAAVLHRHREERLGVRDRGCDLEAVSHDARVRHEPRGIACAEAGDLL